VFFSDFSKNKNAMATWTKTYLPILRANKGWAIFASTPDAEEGQHYAKLYDMACENPRWFVSTKTIEDLGVYSPLEIEQMLQEDREDGMSDRLIQQEYYVRFHLPAEDSYFCAQMLYLDDANQITEVAYDPNLPVATAWDHGNDQGVVWFAQQSPNGTLRIIDMSSIRVWELTIT
jgi:hypothetical protein